MSAHELAERHTKLAEGVALLRTQQPHDKGVGEVDIDLAHEVKASVPFNGNGST